MKIVAELHEVLDVKNVGEVDLHASDIVMKKPYISIWPEGQKRPMSQGCAICTQKPNKGNALPSFESQLSLDRGHRAWLNKAGALLVSASQNRLRQCNNQAQNSVTKAGSILYNPC